MESQDHRTGEYGVPAGVGAVHSAGYPVWHVGYMVLWGIWSTLQDVRCIWDAGCSVGYGVPCGR